MKTRVLIPIKSPERCKTRLRSVLCDEQREALVACMLRRAITIASATPGIDEVLLVKPSKHDLATTIRRLGDLNGRLNGELQSAALDSLEAGVARIIVLMADLPLLSIADVTSLTSNSTKCVFLAPDHRGTGTNAISLPAVHVSRFKFRFGPNSFLQHCLEVERLGLKPQVIRSYRLALDIDLPDDLKRLTALEDQRYTGFT